MFEYDELKMYDGDEIPITKDIVVIQPSLNQIKEFGEKRYFNAVRNLTSCGADLKWQLWDFFGIDYTTISDYDLFIKLSSQLVASRKKYLAELIHNPDEHKEELIQYSKEDLEDMLINPLQYVIKDIDIADFSPCISDKSGQIILYNAEKDITIDKLIYSELVEVVRKIHGFKRNNELPANERTKMDLIEDARDDARMAANKPFKSVLRPLVSFLSVKTGQCGDDRIMNMNICKFFDNIRRSGKIQDAELLLSGAYSGFASLKGIDKSRLDWTGDLGY